MTSTPVIYRRDVVKRPKIFDVWEQYRSLPSVHYVMELFSEAVSRKNIIPLHVYGLSINSQMGVFFYTYAGEKYPTKA